MGTVHRRSNFLYEMSNSYEGKTVARPALYCPMVGYSCTSVRCDFIGVSGEVGEELSDREGLDPIVDLRAAEITR